MKLGVLFVALLSASQLPLQLRTARSSEALQPVSQGDICVTNGEVHAAPGGGLQIDTPSSRAVLRFQTDPVAEIRFRYLGPSAGSKPLASGELRRQIGIKLRAANTCNLVYAMWHIEPDSRVAVSVKRNPGMSEHAQCHAGGYINLKQSGAPSPPRIVAGQEHVLHAELHGSSLLVSADGAEAWRGDLGPIVAQFDGPVGLRTDNARFQFTYFAGARRGASAAGNCAQGPGD